jgi:hypothetical protein
LNPNELPTENYSLSSVTGEKNNSFVDFHNFWNYLADEIPSDSVVYKLQSGVFLLPVKKKQNIPSNGKVIRQIHKQKLERNRLFESELSLSISRLKLPQENKQTSFKL